MNKIVPKVKSGLGVVGRIYSTGQAAALFPVAPRTVSTWCDTGRLKHFKIGQDRRIHESDLRDFALTAGFDKLANYLGARTKIVGYGLQHQMTNLFAASDNDGFMVVLPGSLSRVGAALAGGFNPMLVVDFREGEKECRQLAKDARMIVSSVRCYALIGDDTQPDGLHKLFCGYYSDPHLLIQKILADLAKGAG